MSRALPLVVFLLAAACTGDDDAAAPRAKLTITVLEEPLLFGDPSDRSVEGAEVAFDPPNGGERVVAMTDANGRATFDVEEASLRGDAAVTVYSSEHLSWSRLDVTERELTLVVPRLDNASSDRTVALTGAITGRSPLGSTVDLSTSKLDRLGRASTLTPTYGMRIPRASPFFVVGHEQLATGTLVKSFRIDVPAKDSDARLDVDLASVPTLTPRAVHLRVTPPAAMGADATISANVGSVDSSLILGTPTKREGGDVEMSVVDTDLAGERAVTRVVVVAADGSSSAKTEIGVVTDGATWSDLLPPPTVPDASRLKTDPIPVDGFPDGARLRVEMIAGSKLGWVLLGPPSGLRSKTVVLPPSFRVEFPALVAVTIAAETDPVELGPRRVLHRRVAVSRDVILHR